MSKDTGVAPTTPHVATSNNSSATTPLRGVPNRDSPTARLEVTDTGRSNWAYDLPFIPLNIPRYADFSRFLSLFELIKKHHEDSFDNNGSITAANKPESFDATDITAHRGFLLKAWMSNTGTLHIMNRPAVGGASVGASTDYLGNTIGSATTGPRMLLDNNNVTSNAAYLHFGSQQFMGMPLEPGEALFIEITSASNIYIVPTGAGNTLHWLPS